MRRPTVLWLLLVLIMQSCGSSTSIPSNVLKPARMQVVLWDVLRADAFTNDFIKKDSSKNAVTENVKLQQKIFSANGVTREQFYRSFEYYKTNAPLFKALLDSMISTANRNRSTTHILGK